MILQRWLPNLNLAIWVTAFGGCMILLNVSELCFVPTSALTHYQVLHVKNYGWAQFWLGWAKVFIITALIVVCLAVSLGANSDHEVRGFRYWNDPGAFGHYIYEGSAGGFLGWWASMVSRSV